MLSSQPAFILVEAYFLEYIMNQQLKGNRQLNQQPASELATVKKRALKYFNFELCALIWFQDLYGMVFTLSIPSQLVGSYEHFLFTF